MNNDPDHHTQPYQDPKRKHNNPLKCDPGMLESDTCDGSRSVCPDEPKCNHSQKEESPTGRQEDGHQSPDAQWAEYHEIGPGDPVEQLLLMPIIAGSVGIFKWPSPETSHLRIGHQAGKESNEEKEHVKYDSRQGRELGNHIHCLFLPD